MKSNSPFSMKVVLYIISLFNIFIYLFCFYFSLFIFISIDFIGHSKDDNQDDLPADFEQTQENDSQESTDKNNTEGKLQGF